jgi:hypothetical protein
LYKILSCLPFYLLRLGQDNGFQTRFVKPFMMLAGVHYFLIHEMRQKRKKRKKENKERKKGCLLSINYVRLF